IQSHHGRTVQSDQGRSRAYPQTPLALAPLRCPAAIPPRRRTPPPRFGRLQTLPPPPATIRLTALDNLQRPLLTRRKSAKGHIIKQRLAFVFLLTLTLSGPGLRAADIAADAARDREMRDRYEKVLLKNPFQER